MPPASSGALLFVSPCPRLSAGTLDSPCRIRVVPQSRCRRASRSHYHGITNGCECHKPLEAKKEKRDPWRAPHIPLHSREPTGGRFPVIPSFGADATRVFRCSVCPPRRARDYPSACSIRPVAFALPQSRCRLFPEIIMKSRTDANAINHSKQKRKARAGRAPHIHMRCVVRRAARITRMRQG